MRNSFDVCCVLRSLKYPPNLTVWKSAGTILRTLLRFAFLVKAKFKLSTHVQDKVEELTHTNWMGVNSQKTDICSNQFTSCSASIIWVIHEAVCVILFLSAPSSTIESIKLWCPVFETSAIR